MTESAGEPVTTSQCGPARVANRRFTDLTAEDEELVSWMSDGYPPVLDPLLSRFMPPATASMNVDKGWWPLLRRLDRDIAAAAPNYRIIRLGEDLGVLDFEIVPDHLTEEIADIIAGAQSESTRTCVVCADRAWLYRQGDWLVTLCPDHARARGARSARTDADIAEAVPRPTDREFAFALSAGMPASAFTAQAQRSNRAHVRASADADEAEMSSWLTSTDVARILNTSPDAVNHLRQRGALLGGRRRNGRYAYPSWQLDWRYRPIPGLQTVLAVLSEDEDVVGVSALMTGGWEELGGLSAAQWLAQGRSIETVLRALENSERL
jgi:hypothetical protein